MTRRHISARERERIFDAAGGVCHLCDLPIHAGEAWEVSHPIPLAAGGDDVAGNRSPAHKKCHARRTAEIDAPLIAKTRRQRQKHLGIRKTTRPIAGWRKFDGTPVRAR